MSQYDYVFKILIVGNSNVGKTSLLVRYVDQEFPKHAMATIGVDHKFKTIQVPEYDKTIKLQIWDTAGQERFQSLSRAYWKGVTGVILVFDLTDKSSFDDLNRWVKDIRAERTCKYILLVGNKSDVTQDQRKVSAKEAREYAESEDMTYQETSAKLNEGVEQAFLDMTCAVLEQYEAHGITADDGTGLVRFPVVSDEADEDKDVKKKTCCSNH